MVIIFLRIGEKETVRIIILVYDIGAFCCVRRRRHIAVINRVLSTVGTCEFIIRHTVRFTGCFSDIPCLPFIVINRIYFYLTGILFRV